MNINKFTQKSLQAVERCEKLDYEYGNQEICQEHLLYGLLTIDDSLIAKLIEKMGGSISCYNTENGFCTELRILLA